MVLIQLKKRTYGPARDARAVIDRMSMPGGTRDADRRFATALVACSAFNQYDQGVRVDTVIPHGFGSRRALQHCLKRG
jgi:hypothetical protein